MVTNGADIHRGGVWWADLPEPRRSEPGLRRPVLVIQADAFNLSAIQTVIVAAFTSNLRLREAPGNVFVPRRASRLPKDSVVNVSQLFALDRAFLSEHVSTLPARWLAAVEAGLRLILAL